MKKSNIDKIFFGIFTTLIIVGLIAFTSASLGILAKNKNVFNNILLSQYLYGFIGGLIAMYIGFKIPFNLLKKYSLFLFIASIILTILVFIPKVGQSHNGATRWVNILGFSFQPVEFLKIGFIIYFSAWLSSLKDKIKNPVFSILPLFILLTIIASILLKQPDTKSLILITITASVMLFVSGVPIKYILGFFGIALIGFIILVSVTPYLKQRVNTFINPNENSQTSSWQLQQSLIAIGSGGIFGRGLGQSIQKFNYLPEPQGDSIFAVIGEEIGFIGCTFLIILYIAFAMRGYRISIRNAPDAFTKLIVIGFITIITVQSFMNIASLVGLFPLTGVPLVFISQGGTALFLSMGVMGIILNISRYKGKMILEKSK